MKQSITALAVALCAIANQGLAQGVVTIPAARPLTAPAPPLTEAPAPPPARTSVRIPEGTEVRVQFDEQLSSATASSGDTFSISTDEDIRLSDGTIIRAGYRGKGEVTSADKNGMMGKAGQLNVRLIYMKIGDMRVRLRASKGEEGKNAVTSTVVLTVLFGPLGLIKHGHNIVIPKGQTMVAYVDDDADIPFPVAPPPRGD